MIDIRNITVLNDISERLVQITPEDIERAGKRLAAPSKEELAASKLRGVITAESTQACWALNLKLTGEARLLAAQARLAEQEEIEEDLLRQGSILALLGELVKDVFWTQAKIELDCPEIERCGVRKGWEIREFDDGGDNPMSGFFAQIRAAGK